MTSRPCHQPAQRRYAVITLGSRGRSVGTWLGHAGLLLTRALVRGLEVAETIEEAVNRVRPFKEGQRGLSARELMVSLA